MRRKQVTAILLSAIMMVSACMPVNGIAAFAAENAGAESTEAAEVAEEQEEESAFADAEETEAPAVQARAEETAEEAAEEQEAVISPEEAGEALPEEAEEAAEKPANAETEAEAPAEQNDEAEGPAEQEEAAEAPAEENAAPAAAESANRKTAEAAQEEAEDGSAQTIEEEAKEETGQAALSALQPEDFEGAEEIFAGDRLEPYISGDTQYKVYKFTPDEAGIYYFDVRSSEVELSGQLYDSDYYKVDQTRDASYEFGFSDYLHEGTPFYLVIYPGMGEGYVTIEVDAEEMPDFYVENQGRHKVIRASYGEEVTLSLFAQSPTGKIHYEWYDGEMSELLGTSDTYTFTVDRKRWIRCHVTDGTAEEYTNDAVTFFEVIIENHLTVRAEGADNLDEDYAEIIAAPGSSLTLRVIASADDDSQLEYTWEREVQTTDEWGNTYGEAEWVEGADTAECYIEVAESCLYECKVTDQYGNSVTVRFYIDSDNHLRAYPEGAFEDETSRFLLVKPFESATLKVTALAEDMSQITYQWQELVVAAEDNYDDEDIYRDIEGANEDTYQADSSRNLVYRCKVSDQYENAAYVYFYLEVDNELRAYPEGAEEGSRTVEIYPAPGDTITLKVNPSAIDVSQLAYEWYDDDDNELDSDGPELVVENVTKAKRYRCRVSDQYGNGSTAYFYIRFENHLNVHPAGTRNTDYVYLKAEPHAPLTLKVVAEADDTSQLTYEWRGDYETIDGADTDTYTIPSVEERMEYDCTVTDQYDNQGAVRFYVEVDNKFTAYPEGAEEGQNLVELYADYGKPLTLKAIASAIDEEGIMYRWGSNEYGWYDDASEDEFTISSVTDRGDYWCIVEDAFGNSEQLYFDVHIENHFDVYPEGYKGHDTAYLYVKPGTKVTLNAVVEGDDTGDVYTYWYRDDRWEDIETEEPSITVDAKNAVYVFDASDKYGNFEYTKFVLRLVNGLTAYPEGASMDENGRYQYFVNLYPKAGEQLDLNVIASSDEGALSYEWYEKAVYETSWGEYETDYEPMKDAGNTASVRVTAAKATSYCCTVSDEYGNEQDVEFYIHMGGAGFVAYPEGNEDTHANRIAITAEQGKEMTLRVLTSGEEDAEYTYKWSEGPLNDSGWWPLAEGVDGTKDSLAVTPETSRRYLCVVTDQYGNQGMAYFYVNVNGMTVTTNQGTPALTGDNRYEIYVKAKAGDSVTLTTNVETEQADSLSYYWSYDNFDHASATIGSENSNSITIKAGAAKYYVNTIEDGTGNQVEVWYYFDIDNQLAVYPQEGVEDNTSVDIVTKVGEKLTLAPVVHATDMTKMEYVWSDSNGRSLGEDADLVLSVAREDVITCTVTDRFGTVRVVTYNILFKERPSIVDISQADITIGDVTYNGKAQLPMIGIYGGGRTLIEGTDYTVTCGQNINAGTYPVTINGIGKLTGSVNREYKILKADQTITASDISLQPYETAKITVSGAQGALSYKTSAKAVATVAKDGTVTAVKAGTASITISAAETDNYKAATAQLAVTVNAYDLSSSDCKVTLSQTTAVYNGKEIKPTATVKFGDITLKESTDYTVSYENNVNAGNGAVTIVGNDKTTVNSAKASFTIAKASQEISTDAPADGLKIKIGESAKITVSGAQGDVTFAVADPAVATVAADRAGSGSGAGAAVSATVSAVKAGSTKITVNAAETDNYEAAKALEIVVKVVPATIDVSELQITVNDSGLVYDGKAKTPKVTVKNDGAVLTEGFTVSYKNNVNAGLKTAKAIVTGDNVTLSGTKEVSFTILPGKTTRGDMFNLANNVKVTWQAVPGAKYYKVYRTGVTSASESRKDPVIVTTGLVGWDKDPGLTNGHAYRYTVVASLTGKGDASGDSPKSYSKLMYRLKTVVIRSAKNTAPGKVTVKYDKTTSGDSYVLQYCERQDMVGAKTKVVLGANNTSYVIGGLKKGKTYYISIRVRKKVNGIDYYTTFGVPKKVKIEK